MTARMSRPLSLILLGLLVAGVVWYLAPGFATKSSIESEGRQGATLGREPAPTSKDAAPVESTSPELFHPSETFPELQARADAGDGEAAFALGRLLLGCLHYTEIDLMTLEDELIDAVAADNPFLRAFTGQSSNERAIQLLLDIQGDQERLCEGRELPAQAVRLRRAAIALDRAAQSGHARAQLAWVQAFRQRWFDPQDVVRSAELVRVERERARAYLQQALLSRLPEALLAQHVAHASGDLDSRDRVRAAAYWRAWRRLGSPGAPLPGWLLSEVDGQVAQSVSAQQLKAADALANQLVSEFAS